MRENIRSDAAIWRWAFALTGLACAVVGPYLPTLTATWHLHDDQTGGLVSCLFLGSFTGTVSLSNDLRGSLQRGRAFAFLGMLIFALCTKWAGGFSLGAIALVLMGFGLGQLMGAMNLLVGSGDAAMRARRLAAVGAAWCIGALASPILTTIQIRAVSAPWRIALCSALFLLVPTDSHPREVSSGQSAGSGEYFGRSRLATLCAVMFFLYGGIEASVAGWMPLLAARYELGSVASTQWTSSLFWAGLILSRVTIARFERAMSDESLLRISAVGAALCVLALSTTQSPVAFRIESAAAGGCVGPIFPLLLSSTLKHSLSARAMGLILAACALGAAVFPYLLGLLSSGLSLRMGMLLPLAGLSLIVLLRGSSDLQIAVNPQLEQL